METNPVGINQHSLFAPQSHQRQTALAARADNVIDYIDLWVFLIDAGEININNARNEMEEEKFFSEKMPPASAVIATLLANDPCGCTKKLSTNELRSVYFYTTEGGQFSSKELNKVLQSGDLDASELKFQIYAIDTALNKLNSHYGECYRGEHADGKINRIISEIKIQQATVGDISYVPADFFMSTTIDKSSHYLDRPINYIIIPRDGAKDIRHISAPYLDENEALFKRGTKFIVAEVDDTSQKNKIIITLLEVKNEMVNI